MQISEIQSKKTAPFDAVCIFKVTVLVLHQKSETFTVNIDDF